MPPSPDLGARRLDPFVLVATDLSGVFSESLRRSFVDPTLPMELSLGGSTPPVTDRRDRAATVKVSFAGVGPVLVDAVADDRCHDPDREQRAGAVVAAPVGDPFTVIAALMQHPNVVVDLVGLSVERALVVVDASRAIVRAMAKGPSLSTLDVYSTVVAVADLADLGSGRVADIYSFPWSDPDAAALVDAPGLVRHRPSDPWCPRPIVVADEGFLPAVRVHDLHARTVAGAVLDRLDSLGDLCVRYR